MLLAYIYRLITHRVHFLDKTSRDLFIRAKDLLVEATASPQIWIPCLPSPRRRCNSWSSPLAHQSRDMSAHHFALNAQALFILFWCIRRHVF